MVSASGLGVFCLEGDWDAHLGSRRSVKGLLGFLEDLGSVRVIRRDVATRTELEHYLDRWHRYTTFSMLYLAFHGSARHLELDGDISVDELANVLRGRCGGRLIHFASCSTMRVPQAAISAFKRTTGAAYVSGYRRMIDFVDSALLDAALLEALSQNPSRPGAAYARVARDHEASVKRLGFTFD